MNNNKNGYIKLHRKLLNSPVIKDAELFQLFTYILLKSTHKYYKSMVGLQPVKLEAGQMVFGRNVASADLGMSASKLRKRMQVLEKLEIITSKTTNKFTLVTVSNWAMYQNEETQTASKTTNKQPSKDQQTTNKQPTNNHIQEHKTHKEQEEHKEDSMPFDIDKDIFKEFKKMRVRIKSPMTDRAEKLLIGEIGKHVLKGENANQILEQSILNGWKTVYPYKGNNNGKTRQHNTSITEQARLLDEKIRNGEL